MTFVVGGSTRIGATATPPPAVGAYQPFSAQTGPNGIYSAHPLSAPTNVTYATSVVTLGSTAGFTTAGTYTGYLFGRIISKAAGFTFNSCWVQGIVGESIAGSSALVDCNDAGSGTTTFNDCIVAVQPGAENTALDCWIGHDYICNRCEGSGGVDIWGVYNAHNSGGNVNVTLSACYGHDYTGFHVAPGHPNGSHNDTVQYQGGKNVLIDGCNLVGNISPTLGDGPTWSGNDDYSNPAILNGLTGNSCLQFNTNTGALANFTVRNTWIDGGYITANGSGAAMDSTCKFINIHQGRNNGAQAPVAANVPVEFETGARPSISSWTYGDNGAATTIKYV